MEDDVEGKARRENRGHLQEAKNDTFVFGN